MLGERQQAMLRAVARDPKDPLFGKPNELLNLAIDRIMLEQPNAFLEEKDFKALNLEVICLIKAFDDSFSQNVYSRSSYIYNEIVWNAKYSPMTEFTNNGTLLHLDKLNLFEKVE